MKVKFIIKMLIIIAAAVLIVFAFEGKRIYGLVSNSCYIKIGGSEILLTRISGECFIRGNDQGQVWVVQTNNHVHFTVCGSYKDDPVGWGFNFVHFSKGDSYPFISSMWYEFCGGSKSDLTFMESETYLQSMVDYTVLYSNDPEENYKNITNEEFHSIRNSFVNGKQELMSRSQLDDLVAEYLDIKNESYNK